MYDKSRFSLLALMVALIGVIASSVELFSVKFVEQNGSRLIATSNSNYAISSPKLASSGWRTISINGDQVLAISLTGERLPMTRSGLSSADLLLVEGLRDEIANSNGGYMHTSTAAGTGGRGSFDSGFSMTSGTGATVTSSSYSSAVAQQQGGGGGGVGVTNGGDLSYNMRDSNNFSVARSDMPFSWSRVFFNDDLVTLIFRDGQVQMLPIGLLEPAQLEAVNALKRQIGDMQRLQAGAMQNSMNMVSNVFSNIMSRFPPPPSYQSAVGNMFGDNFPFGSNNSPFDSASGWPFGGGAMAIAA